MYKVKLNYTILQPLYEDHAGKRKISYNNGILPPRFLEEHKQAGNTYHRFTAF